MVENWHNKAASRPHLLAVANGLLLSWRWHGRRGLITVRYELVEGRECSVIKLLHATVDS